MALTDHALNNDGIPLIGIDPIEVRERCDRCFRYYHLSNVCLSWPNRFLCEPCVFMTRLAESLPPAPNPIYGND